MAAEETPSFELDAITGTLGLANQDSGLTACRLHLAVGGGLDPQTFRSHPASNGRQQPCWFTYHTGGERVRTMPTPCGAIRFQIGAGALAGSLSKLADGRGPDPQTLRSHPVSNGGPAPAELTIQTGARRGSRTPKTSRSERDDFTVCPPAQIGADGRIRTGHALGGWV
jgi:hypothetical protein